MESEASLSMPLPGCSPQALRHFTVLATYGIVALELLFWIPTPATLVGVVAGLALYLLAYRRIEYLDPLVAFSVPWVVILIFSVTPMSEYAEPVSPATYRLILFTLLTALFASGQRFSRTQRITVWQKARPSMITPGFAILLIDLAFLFLTVLNIAIAGYIPLIRGILTGDTGYLDFGVHGLYGFYLAFSNALGIFHLVLYFRTGRRWHLCIYFSLFVLFILFITRQNLLSLGVEGVIVYSLMRKRFSLKKIVLWMALAGVMFSVIGSFRSGNIKTLAKIKPEYAWVPDPVIWLYSYSYFNVANVNKLVLYSDAPFYDGSSLSQLVPSFLRPSYEDRGSYLEVEIFNVSSFLYPVYSDMGTLGVVVLTSVAVFSTYRLRKAIYQEASLFRIGAFSTLYFCAAFSFFVNFWFYLPIIFQVVFFKLFSNLTERVAEAGAAEHHRGLPSGTESAIH